MRLRLLTGDDPLQTRRLAWTLAETEPQWRWADLSAEGWLGGSIQFEPLRELDQRWATLEPLLRPWLELLQLGNLSPEHWPLLPGVDNLLRGLFLLDLLQEHPNDDWALLLPPPAASLTLLNGIGAIPLLLQRLYDPLLQRLSNLRSSLSSLEALLNLQLPDASGLALPAKLRQRLLQLVELVSDPQRCELLLALPASQASSGQLADRLCGFHLNGLQLSRLWLEGPASEAELQSLRELLGPTQLLHTSHAEAFPHLAPAWLALPWRGEQGLSEQLNDNGEALLSLLLPGLRKEHLQVQQLGTQLLLRVGNQRRLLALPPHCAARTASGAKLAGRRLEVRFR